MSYDFGIKQIVNEGLLYLSRSGVSNLSIGLSTVNVTCDLGESVYNFSILPFDEDEGLICLTTQRGSGLPAVYLLYVNKDESGIPHLCIDREDKKWLPTADKVTQFHGTYLDVIIGGEKFTNDPDGPKKGKRLPKDPNILLHYLLDRATADEVRASATELELESALRDRLEMAEMRIKEIKRYQEMSEKDLAVYKQRDERTASRVKHQFTVIVEPFVKNPPGFYHFIGKSKNKKVKAKLNIALEALRSYADLDLGDLNSLRNGFIDALDNLESCYQEKNTKKQTFGFFDANNLLKDLWSELQKITGDR